MNAVDFDGNERINMIEFAGAFAPPDVSMQSAVEVIVHNVARTLFTHKVLMRHAFTYFDPELHLVISRDNFLAALQAFNAQIQTPISEAQLRMISNSVPATENGYCCSCNVCVILGRNINYEDFLDSLDSVVEPE